MQYYKQGVIPLPIFQNSSSRGFLSIRTWEWVRRNEHVPFAFPRLLTTACKSDSRVSGCTCFAFWARFFDLLRLSGFELYIKMNSPIFIHGFLIDQLSKNNAKRKLCSIKSGPKL